MKPQKKYFITTGLVLFLFLNTGFAFASSATFLTQAQKFINQNCNKKLFADQPALLCYLFNKSQEQDTKLETINATLSPIPSQITSLNQQYQTLSASMSSIQTPVQWDISGKYTLRLFPIYDTPDSRIITINSVDPITGAFSGTGSHSSTSLTVSGIINGSQFTLQTQANGSFDLQVQGSISPNGKLWGVGYGSNGHGFTMTTLSGAATKKN